MRKLEIPNDVPAIDDKSNLNVLENHYSEVSSSVKVELDARYSEYETKMADPWQIGVSVFDIHAADRLKKIFDYEPYVFSYIDEIRHSSRDVCPMCGGKDSYSVDHYFPREDYPEYSVFSKNLIPACVCNSRKGTKLKGGVSPARLIHPLFDGFASDRLFKIVFSGSLEAPNMKFALCNPNHNHKEILEFHMNTMLDHESVWRWFDKKWGSITRKPKDIFGVFMMNQDIVDISKFSDGLKSLEKYETASCGTPNNWFSILLYGLLTDSSRLAWLKDTYNNSVH